MQPEGTVERRDKPKTLNRLGRVIDLWAKYAPFRDLAGHVANGETTRIAVTGLSGSSDAFLIRALSKQSERPLLIVTRHTEEANDIYDDLTTLFESGRVGHYPSRQILPYDFRAPVGEIMGRRIDALAGLLDRSLSVVVCPLRALMEPTIPVSVLTRSRVNVRVGDTVDLDDLTDRLVHLGFQRVPLVEEVGDFARRGGLIDLFTPGSDAPIRIEFFDDVVETIRQFDVGTQRTTGKLDHVTVLPKREISVRSETLEEYLKLLPEEDSEYIRVRYLNDPELPGLEWLSLLFNLEQGSLLDYLSDDTVIFLNGEDTLRDESDAILVEAHALHERLKNRLSRLPMPHEYYTVPEKLFERVAQFSTIDNLPFRGGHSQVISFNCHPHPAFNARLDLLGKAVLEYDTLGITYFIASDNETQAARLDEIITQKAGLAHQANIEVADIRGGFVCEDGRFAVLTDHEIFSRHHRRIRRKKFKEGVAISDYSSLNVGDYVVHTEHGIARYLGLQTLVVDKRHRDLLLLQYDGSDRLYVPIEEFNRVSKYAGKDSAPALTKLGGPGWEKTKEKTKKAIADMAADLIKLYARRKAGTGFSFGEDSVWLKQLEAAFPYDETPDQQKAIDDVKRDMKEERPMDRLVCGDVGYGKTEVAIRAAFKAMDAGKQVAVLVPTTILAQQHFATFSERLADYPFKVALMSRFRTKAEQALIAKNVADGKIELVIGTHRLLSKDMKFKDLGMLIIDEEHRFGVKHKEKLREFKATVDTLAMTATPIPRTLQMSLLGVRDMSIIETSPKDRLPIITEIVEFDPAIIATAILREVDRGGQVFFVHNRVQTIDAMYNYLKRIVPNVEIAIAHGQMHERSLEGVMLAFLARRFDVLLCTSIIESGLDITNANTILINRADRFGLAQLYQIRGRVGRSAKRAYAYLMTPPTRLLTADAVKRLRALEAHSDLGAGFALAMRDLEIRGAGTILGARQSGYIEEVGYDMYNRLLEEAVAEIKGEEIVRLPETKLELDLELHLPDAYVNDRQHKVDIYRRLADAGNLDEVEKIREEVIDRFGKPPQSAVFLFDATAVKIAAALLEIEKVKLKAGVAHLFFKEKRKLTRVEVEALRKGTDCPMEFSFLGHPRITIDLRKIPDHERLSHLRGVLGKVG
jgi:transcription-repair coupling factor (superfamily II helicase)